MKEKHEEKKKSLVAVTKYKKELKDKGENGRGLDSFLNEAKKKTKVSNMLDHMRT
jgi:hypothetical protein